MSEEIKEESVEEEKEVATEEEEEVSLADLEDEESEEEGKEEEPDWKAIAAKQQERVRQLNGALKEERSKRKEAQAKKEDDKEEAEDVEDKGEDEIEARIQRAVREALAGNSADTLETVLESKVSNPDKRELVKSIYESRINKSGHSRRAIEDDIELAILAADREAYQLGAQREARKEVAQKVAIKKSSMGVASKAQNDVVQFSKEDRAIAKELKMDVKTYVLRKKQLATLNR